MAYRLNKTTKLKNDVQITINDALNTTYDYRNGTYSKSKDSQNGYPLTHIFTTQDGWLKSARKVRSEYTKAKIWIDDMATEFIF